MHLYFIEICHLCKEIQNFTSDTQILARHVVFETNKILQVLAQPTNLHAVLNLRLVGRYLICLNLHDL